MIHPADRDQTWNARADSVFPQEAAEYTLKENLRFRKEPSCLLP